jgi:hypothetical protein
MTLFETMLTFVVLCLPIIGVGYLFGDFRRKTVFKVFILVFLALPLMDSDTSNTVLILFVGSFLIGQVWVNKYAR